MSNSPVEIRFSLRFKKDVKRLVKRYRHIQDDLDPFIANLAQGNLLGDMLQGEDYVIYKARVPNQDAGRGKSGGYRVIYYLVQTELIVLVTLYSKSDQEDISLAEISHMLVEILDELSDSEE